MKIITLKNIKDIEKFKKTGFILQFSALWCGPCMSITPLIQDYLKDIDSEYVYIYCNVDKFIDLTKEHNIKSVPSFIVYHNDLNKYSKLFNNSDLNNVINFLVTENIVESNIKHNTKPICNT